jgi:hypothetical protein
VRPDRDRPIEAEGRTVLERDLHCCYAIFIAC